MTENKSFLNAMTVLGLLLAIGMASAAFILGVQAKSAVVAHAPQYLVSDLEEIKMSLIADATKNARARATEFVKQDGAKFGVMKSAQQGAFYILPVGGSDDSDSQYGGVYDKSTIAKWHVSLLPSYITLNKL